MSLNLHDSKQSTPTALPTRLPLWLAGALLAVFSAALFTPLAAQAGTVTIVDGPAATSPAGGVYTDGYIQEYLTITGSLTITTTGVVTGPDEIRVLEGSVITWTTGNTLTLDAGTNVVISGTLQHDGPADGAGGLHLLAPNGGVLVGNTDQITGTAAGSRFGLTRVQAQDLVLAGGMAAAAYAQLGYHAVDQGAGYTVTGAISVTVSQNVTATGGGANYAYVQIGHGGADSLASATLSGDFSGPIAVEAGGDVTFRGGSEGFTSAQLGNGGFSSDGNHSGDHRLDVVGNVTFQAGGEGGNYAQLGNGGFSSDGNHSGSHRLDAGGDVLFQGGSEQNAYAQFGNGGIDVSGDANGQQHMDVAGDVTFLGGIADFTYAHFGNGGYSAAGNHTNSHLISAGGDVTFRGGSGANAYAQLGNGGSGASGNHSGSHDLAAGGDVRFEGGDDRSYAHFGNGGYDADGNDTNSDPHTLFAGGDILLTGGSGSASYAQFGNGGFAADGDHRGDLSLQNNGSLTVTLGSGQDAYALIGHGADVRITPIVQGEGNRAGDIELRVGDTAVFSASQVGHLTESGVLSVTAGNTLIGVSRNNPFTFGAGQLLITGVTTTTFTSAPTANGGELRFYLPTAASQQTPLNATFNGDTFAVTNTIPITQLAGFAPFGEGPYIPDYSFYLGGQSDLAIAKSADPAGPLRPGDALTYTVNFSNTGDVTATNVVLNDLLPTVLTGTVATLFPDSGIVISQTSGAPNFAWSITDLGPGQGGQVVLATNLLTTGLSLGATFTNTAAINATGDFTLTNNTATVSRTLIAGATLTVTKVVSGAVPSNAWQYTLSGGDPSGPGSFTLPAAGGSTAITGLLPATYTITETVQTGFTSVAACTDGASGSNSVQVTLAPSVAVACVFTNTAAGPLVRMGLPAIHVGP